jgi:hypothetical protein
MDDAHLDGGQRPEALTESAAPTTRRRQRRTCRPTAVAQLGQHGHPKRRGLPSPSPAHIKYALGARLAADLVGAIAGCHPLAAERQHLAMTAYSHGVLRDHGHDGSSADHSPGTNAHARHHDRGRPRPHCIVRAEGVRSLLQDVEKVRRPARHGCDHGLPPGRRSHPFGVTWCHSLGHRLQETSTLAPKVCMARERLPPSNRQLRGRDPQESLRSAPTQSLAAASGPTQPKEPSTSAMTSVLAESA